MALEVPDSLRGSAEKNRGRAERGAWPRVWPGCQSSRVSAAEAWATAATATAATATTMVAATATATTVATTTSTWWEE